MTDVSADWGFAPRQRDGATALIELWKRALAAVENAPTCICHGIVSGRIDPDGIETNMLSYLRTRYREAGRTELVALLEKRLRKSPFAGMRTPFEAWLRTLASLPDAERETLTGDLATELQSFTEAQADLVCIGI